MKLANIQLEVDTHTHTLLSGHAWSTLDENCRDSALCGIKALCMTDHGPAMKGGMVWFAPNSFGALPSHIHGVQVVPGIEFNIIDRHGTLDITQINILKRIRFGIASMHDITMPHLNKDLHTHAYIAALNNPAVDILGHPGNSHFDHDPLPIVLEAKRLNKLIEINNGSFASRAGSHDNCVAFAKLCKKHEVRICVSSDAHHSSQIGKFPLALEMLDEIQFPPELICNRTVEGFFTYLKTAHPAHY